MFYEQNYFEHGTALFKGDMFLNTIIFPFLCNNDTLLNAWSIFSFEQCGPQISSNGLVVRIWRMVSNVKIGSEKTIFVLNCVDWNLEFWAVKLKIVCIFVRVFFRAWNKSGNKFRNYKPVLETKLSIKCKIN
jgi:hypothetical protein